MADDDKMDVPEVLRLLTAALRLQYRSALLYSITAGTVGGVEGLALGALLAEHAQYELEDVQRLADKLVTLGGKPPTDLPTLKVPVATTAALKALVKAEDECVAAMHKVIEPSGQEPRSEALEHLMEHVIVRKQAQIDRINRALR
jgi:ferritin-like protein